MPDRDLLCEYRRQDMWSDFFNPFFSQCEDIWDEFENNPQLLESYELCHRMADCWRPDTVDHAAKYLERKRSRGFEHPRLSRKHDLSNESPEQMSSPRIQQRRGSMNNINRGMFFGRQTQLMQHQYSAEDFLQKKPMRRHSSSPSLPTLFKKRKRFSGSSDQEPYKMPPARSRVGRRLARPRKRRIPNANRMVLETREEKPQENTMSASHKETPGKAPEIQPDEMDFESLSVAESPPAPARFEDPRISSIVAESVQEFGFSKGPTSAPAAHLPTQRYNEGILNRADFSRVWESSHRKGDNSNDADNEEETEEVDWGIC
ncbi:hypothetical protein HYFRA_00006791 [Hymenoscyphus fraxineus]|uniref:Uncharacterized protein n=1 Tax=Hymenoscyphus fraxineus TaxID=746836 RepID=A0A9N9KNP3_9HELO|nr:hypothetical protein HYFRA_00006791 [Hymenoscyphus fraxineus]